MKIKYLGRSSFLITSSDSVRIVTDPYTPSFLNFNYAPINETADIVTVSHAHGDHSNAAAIKGDPLVLTKAGEYKVKDIEVKGIQTYHDESRGKQRGTNIVFVLVVDGLHICHLGDLGHRLDVGQIKELGTIDIVFVPVGGFFTIDASMAGIVCDDLKAKLIFTMHYKTSKEGDPIAKVDDFLRGKSNIIKSEKSEFEVDKQNLPQKTQIVVLQPAL